LPFIGSLGATAIVISRRSPNAEMATQNIKVQPCRYLTKYIVQFDYMFNNFIFSRPLSAALNNTMQ